MDKRCLMDVANRLNKRANELGLKQAEIARQLGITRGSVNQWFNGNTKPSGEKLVQLAKLMKTSADWISSGKGLAQSRTAESANVETLKRAAKIIRNAEMLSGQPFSLDDFSEKLAEVYFRLENDLSLEGILNQKSDNFEQMKAASLKAQDLFAQVLARPGIMLNDNEQKELYSKILSDAYDSILLNQEIDSKAYIAKK